jgi:sortase A
MRFIKRSSRARARTLAVPNWLGAEAMVLVPALREPLRSRAAHWFARLRRVLGARRLTLALGSALALWGLGGAAYIQAKAALSQVLLRQAWTRTLESGVAQRPWPWADTWPVARLTVPRLGVDQIVLAGASGRTMAFGPGLSTAAARPGEDGATVISAHRDTHFRFLRELAPGDHVWIETARGRHGYVVERADVADARVAWIDIGGRGSRLTLVTCYPFDALSAGGPLRYVVSARLAASDAVARADDA